MSLINKVLQDLDRRQAPGAMQRVGVSASAPGVQERHGREWFWRVVAALLLVAIGWVAWVSYHIGARPLATELALRAAEEARARPPARPKPAAPVAEIPTVTAPAPTPTEVAAASTAPVSAPAPAPAPTSSEPAKPAPPPSTPKPAALPESMKLALSIDTPIVEPAAPAKPVTQKSAAVRSVQPQVIAKAPTYAASGKVERRDRVVSNPERAESEFRHGADLLKLGRATEAQGAFTKALDLEGKHRGARQALVAMQLERGQLEPARRLLEEGLALEPAQPDFAVTLARILIERKDLPGALAALDRSAASASGSSDYQTMRATVLQRMGRHAEAAEAYQAAVQLQPAAPQAWVGLGISLEAVNRRNEAADAFRRALAAGPASAEVKNFAEQRIRALR